MQIPPAAEVCGGWDSGDAAALKHEDLFMFSFFSLSLSLSLCLSLGGFACLKSVSDGVALRICDSMAASLMQRFGVDACVAGADRVAANGDTANKIGTYALADTTVCLST